ncbi:MAG: hypothetical protein ACFFAN_20950 [Promethearchaeota archaeon]
MYKLNTKDGLQDIINILSNNVRGTFISKHFLFKTFEINPKKERCYFNSGIRTIKLAFWVD